LLLAYDCVFCGLQDVNDLLKANHGGLKVRESPTKGVYVEGLSWYRCSTEAQVMECVAVGEKLRKTAATAMNQRSSRSHTLLTLVVKREWEDGTAQTGRLSMADLAGSENTKKSQVAGVTFEEAAMINRSLSALGNCIHALTDGKRNHTPYRDSRLTFILRDSLGGNTKTALVVACSPMQSNFEESVSTLRFAERAKLIRNTVRINKVRSVEELEKLVTQLQAQLQHSGGSLEQQELVAKLQVELAEAHGQIGDLEVDVEGSKKLLVSITGQFEEAQETLEEAKESNALQTIQQQQLQHTVKRLEADCESAEQEAITAVRQLRSKEQADRKKEEGDLLLQAEVDKAQHQTSLFRERCKVLEAEAMALQKDNATLEAAIRQNEEDASQKTHLTSPGIELTGRSVVTASCDLAAMQECQAELARCREELAKSEKQLFGRNQELKDTNLQIRYMGTAAKTRPSSARPDEGEKWDEEETPMTSHREGEMCAGTAMNSNAKNRHEGRHLSYQQREHALETEVAIIKASYLQEKEAKERVESSGKTKLAKQLAQMSVLQQRLAQLEAAVAEANEATNHAEGVAEESQASTTAARQEVQQLLVNLHKAERDIAKADAVQGGLGRAQNMLAQAGLVQEALQLELSSSQDKIRALEADRQAEVELQAAKLKSVRWELAQSQDAQAADASLLRRSQSELIQTKNELSETRLSLNKEARTCLQAIEAKERLMTRVKALEPDAKALGRKNEDLSTELAHQDSLAKQLDRDLVQARSQVQELQQRLAFHEEAAQGEASEAQSMVSKLSSEVAAFQGKLQRSKDELSLAHDKAVEWQCHAEEQERKVVTEAEDFSKRIADGREDLHEAREDLVETKQKLDASRTEAADLTEKLEAAAQADHKRTLLHREEVTNLETALEKAKTAHAVERQEQERCLVQVRKEKNLVSVELARLQEDMEEMEERIFDLQEQKEEVEASHTEQVQMMIDKERERCAALQAEHSDALAFSKQRGKTMKAEASLQHEKISELEARMAQHDKMTARHEADHVALKQAYDSMCSRMMERKAELEEANGKATKKGEAQLLQEMELLQLLNAKLTETVEQLTTNNQAMEQQRRETELQGAQSAQYWMKEQEDSTSEKEAADVRAQEAQLRSQQWAHQVGTLDTKLREAQADLKAARAAARLSQEQATQELDAQAHIGSALEAQLTAEAQKLEHERGRVMELEVQLEKTTEVSGLLMVQ